MAYKDLRLGGCTLQTTERGELQIELADTDVAHLGFANAEVRDGTGRSRSIASDGGRLAELDGRVIDAAVAEEDGTLILRVDDGLELRVSPEDSVEAWQLTTEHRGLVFVCPIGGGLSEFRQVTGPGELEDEVDVDSIDTRALHTWGLQGELATAPFRLITRASTFGWSDFRLGDIYVGAAGLFREPATDLQAMVERVEHSTRFQSVAEVSVRQIAPIDVVRALRADKRALWVPWRDVTRWTIKRGPLSHGVHLWTSSGRHKLKWLKQDPATRVLSEELDELLDEAGTADGAFEDALEQLVARGVPADHELDQEDTLVVASARAAFFLAKFDPEAARDLSGDVASFVDLYERVGDRIYHPSLENEPERLSSIALESAEWIEALDPDEAGKLRSLVGRP